MICSCSIKENRIPCPCYVFFDVPSTYADEDSITYHVFAREEIQTGVLSSNQIRTRNHKDITIKKGDVTVTCTTGYDYGTLSETAYIIPTGHTCDSLFSHRTTLSAYGDEIIAPMIEDKQFALMNISFTMGDETIYPYYAVLTTNSKGVSLQDYTPVEGKYWQKGIVTSEKGNEFSFIMPRQKSEGGSIIVSLYNKETDDLLCGVELAEEITSQGYDWNKESLDDLHIEIDYIISKINVTVIPWKQPMKEEIII